MTEGSAARMKRNGARLFKNPPQPHMCIQDFIQGTTAPCYVNVLSWDKVEMPCRPSQPVPLYGGMRVPPPRTKAEAVVFAVMAHPEVLRMNGKNAQDPKKRSTLIGLLLDFVEAMNTGVVFTRRYTILKDRDITGELKEVWNAVQVRRDREQPPPQQETWIDAQPPVPQYPQYQDQQQQQQQQEYAPQPPQYHTSVAYGRTRSNDGMHYESYTHHSQNPVIQQNDQLYQSGQIVPQQYHGNMPRIMPDSYNYRDGGRENMVQNIPQQSCPAYPTPQYQFQQLPRQMVPQYVNSNVHPNANLSYGPPANSGVNPAMGANLAAPFQPYITYQQRMDNTIHVDIRRMQQQQQQQQQQMHMNHVQPVLQYDAAASFNVQATSSMNVLRLGRPHMGVAQKNNASKRQMNSPTHMKQSQSCTNCQTKDHQSENNGTKPKSPVKVLQREVPIENRQENNAGHATESSMPIFPDKSQPMSNQEDAKNVQVTDLDEDVRKTNDTEFESIVSKKQNDTSTTESRRDVRRENSTNEAEVKQPQDQPDPVQGILPVEQKNQKMKIHVMKSNKHKDNVDSNRTIRIRLVQDQNKVDSPKRSQTTVNSIIKSVFKIHPGMSGEEASSGKRKSNGQVKGSRATENEETQQQGYTILKKNSESAQEEVMSEIAQISIQDCKDATEVAPVLS